MSIFKIISCKINSSMEIIFILGGVCLMLALSYLLVGSAMSFR